MNTLDFFQSFIHPSCHKIEHNLTELNLIKTQRVHLVKATTLYQIYKHNVFETNGRLTVKEFYQIAGQYLYYDKYVCTHGTEFYYYVVFNETHPVYLLTKELIDKRIYANRPALLRDLIRVYPAVMKEVTYD